MSRYVLGFAFAPDGRVILLRKQRPDWQAGKLNGVGGHVLDGEEFAAAMVREFEEEAGVSTGEDTWRYFCRLRGLDWSCHCYAAHGIAGAKTTTDEAVELHPVGLLMLKTDVIANVKWLVPMAHFDRAHMACEVIYP